MMIPVPPGAYASYVSSSSSVPSVLFPAPFATARSMLSLGMFCAFALSIASLSLKFISGSGEPSRAATVISLESLVKSCPRRASATPFLCFMVLHFECPDILFSL